MDGQKSHEIDRKAASRLLKISTRSIDRYIRNGKLPARRVLGRILISRENLMQLQNGEPMALPREMISMTRYEHETPEPRQSGLYEDALRTLSEKNMKLEQAQYRIGQLESQITSPYAFKALSGTSDASLETLRQSLMAQEKQNAELQEKTSKEKLNRNILAGIVYILLILQPVLWYFLKP